MRADRARKSVGAENTFFEDLHAFEAMREAMQPLLDKVWRHCDSHALQARTVTLKVKYTDFKIVTRRLTTLQPVLGRADLEAVSLDLLRPLTPPDKGVRLLGVSVSGFRAPAPRHEGGQMSLSL